MRKAVVLLSGGLDSSTTLYYAKSKGYRCHCLIFDYGQRHRREIGSAKRVAQSAKCKTQVIKIKLPWKGSSLLDRKVAIPEVTKSPSYQVTGIIPTTYVPGRNIIFLSFALSYAEAIGAEKIFIGANVIDYSGYPDCKPEFFKAFQEVIRKGTKAGSTYHISRTTLRVEAPLIKKSKKEIVKLAKKLNVPLELTWSCYKGGRNPCGVCDSCVLRAKGFREAGIRDPLILYGDSKNY